MAQSENKSPQVSVSPSSSHSAVSALQFKVKEISQRRSKGKVKHDLEGSVEYLQNKSDIVESSSSQASLAEVVESKSGIAEASEAPLQNRNFMTSSHPIGTREKSGESTGVKSLVHGHGEKSSLETSTKAGVESDAISKLTSSPGRCWKPPKGFWKPIQLETHLLNKDGDSSDIKNVARPIEVEVQKEQKLLVCKETQRQGSMETKTDGQWRVKSKIKVSSLASAERREQTPELVCKGSPPSYKETDWDSVTFGPALSFRSELILSPRHEHAKRLLERARSKARSQNNINDLKSAARPTQRDDLEAAPMFDTPPLVSENAQKPLPVRLQYVQSKNSEQRMHSWKQDQSSTRVRFEDKSWKKAEHCYLDRGDYQMSLTVEKSYNNQQPEAEMSTGLDSSRDNLGHPIKTQTNEESSLETALHKHQLRKCDACGSILAPDTATVPSPTPRKEGHEESTTQPVSNVHSSHQIIRLALLRGVTLSGSSSLDETVEVSGASGAGEGISAFGKLRRRSRNWENRAEASHGPYIRGQELLAQRRNSRIRSSLDETAGPLSKQKDTPVRGVTFAIDNFLPASGRSRSNKVSSGLQLPIKSALKSGSKNRPMGQRVVKLQPSVQYHLINLDNEGKASSQHPEGERQEQLSMTLSSTSLQAAQGPSGFAACIRPTLLRLSSRAATPELQAPEMWTVADSVQSSSEDICRESICAASRPCQANVRGAGVSKAEGLRAELLRLEHRKAELQWDEIYSRRTFEREGRPKLSLRRFFSAMGLNSVGKLVKGSRSSSMEQLSISSSRASPSLTHRGQAPLQRTPSLQALYTKSPLAQLRKVSSVQSLQSPKRKHEHFNLPGELSLPLSLGSRDLVMTEGLDKSEVSRASGPLGRLVQSYPDGTLLLELSRPANAPFGFVISREKGRPDSGIYVEKIVGSATENIYTSLLGVGDEILEVNGEMVAGLNLDQVIGLMTHRSTATIRINPHRWIQH